MTVDSAATVDLPHAPVTFIDSPRHPLLRQLHEYWLAKRSKRLMPARSDLNPADFKAVLPDVIIWNAVPPYLIRLVGDQVVRFVGSNNTGLPATQEMPPDAGRVMTMVLETVVGSKSPRFRLGKAFWKPGKAYRDFDGETVDMILGGLKYDIESNAA